MYYIRLDSFPSTKLTRVQSPALHKVPRALRRMILGHRITSKPWQPLNVVKNKNKLLKVFFSHKHGCRILVKKFIKI